MKTDKESYKNPLRLRQFDPSFVATETGCIGWIIDQTGGIVEYPTAALR